MLRLHYSSDLATLIDVLAEAPPLRRRNLLDPVAVAVPGSPTAAHLERGLATAIGICHSVELATIEASLADILTAAGKAPATRAGLAQELLAAFADEALLGQPDLAPVARYLGAGPGEQSRRFQLADEVAGLFLDYDRARPELLRAWTRGRAGSDVMHSRERWQSTLWRHVHLERGASPLVTTLLDAAPLPGSSPLIVAGFYALPPGYCHALAKVAEGTDVYVFALAPTREFWEDIISAERHGVSSAAPGRALRLWGRAMGITARLLGDACGYDFQTSFRVPEAEHALGMWQRDTHQLTSSTSAGGTNDGSVRIHRCTSMRRELEAIAESIWQLLESDESLDCADIAVFVASEYEIYLSHLPAVFESHGGIPHHLVAAPVELESRLAEGFELLVELPLGEFTRAEMLAIMIHPCIGPGTESGFPDFWLRLAEELGIARAPDAAALAESYIRGDLFNWDQGIRRVCLGALYGDRDRPEILRLDGPEYVPMSVEGDRRESAVTFALFARSLIADAREALDLRLPLADWSRWFECLARSYLRPRSSADERLYDRLAQTIDGLRRIDNGTAIGYRLAAATIRREMANLRSNFGEVGASGVMVAPLDLGSVIPARHVFVAGLGEEALPAAGFASALDVRTTAFADLEPAEWTRAAFFAATLSARESLHLSYVGRDPATGDTLAPSSLASELRSLLLRGYVADERSLTAEHALHAWYEPGAASSPSRAVRRRFAMHQRAANGSMIGQPNPSSIAAHDSSARPLEEIRLDHLRAFLESPVQGWARHSLGMYEDRDDEHADVRDEPLEVGPLQTSTVLRDVFVDGCRAGDDLARLKTRLRDRLRREELAGHLPTGIFGDRLTRSLEDTLAHWLDVVGASPRPVVRSFGGNRTSGAVDESHPPLEVEVDGIGPVALVGASRPQIEGIGSLIMTPSKSVSPKHRVRGFFDHLVTVAAGLITDEGGYAVLGLGDCHRTYRLAAVERSQALDYLRHLVTELCSSTHDYAFPCEQALSRDPSRPISGTSSDDYGPMKLAHPLPQPADPMELYRSRFGLLKALEERVD